MQARAHLKLIVSGRPHDLADDSAQDRISMVQPVSSMRLHRQWLRVHGGVLALWCASLLLLALVGLLLVGRP